MKNMLALLAGTIFGAGLAISGMTDRTKVLGFLDLFGHWDPTLLFVMAAALAIALPSFYWIRKRQKPVFNHEFYFPKKTQIDFPLIAGAIIFGIGWGAFGYCPGPALAALSYFQIDSVIFVVAMLVGLLLPTILKKINTSTDSQEQRA